MRLDSKTQAKLATEANKSIQHALRHGAAGAPKPQDEPDAVACVTLGAVPDIATTWSAVLQPFGHTAFVAGVFIHKSPRVRFSGKVKSKSLCELADLLVVVDELSQANVRHRRAILVQAKVADKGQIKIKNKSEAVQLDLYSRWPPFEFERTSEYGVGFRDIVDSPTLGKVADSGRYGGIELNAPCAWMQIDPNTKMKMTQGVDFGAFLVGMIVPGTANYGRRFIARGDDDWSRTINDLLRATSKETFILRSSFGDAPMRRNTTGLMYFLRPYQPGSNWQISRKRAVAGTGGAAIRQAGTAGDAGDGGRTRERDGDGDGDGDGGGISVLRISVRPSPSSGG